MSKTNAGLVEYATAQLGKDRRGICRMCHTEKEHGGYAWKFTNGGIIDENGIRVS